MSGSDNPTRLEVVFSLAAEPADFDRAADHLVDFVDVDGSLWSVDDSFFVTAGVYVQSGQHRVDMLLDLADRIERALDVTIDSIDLDLVDVSEIAERVGLTREGVRNWLSNPRRTGGTFPKPLGILPGKVRVWSWYDIHSWIQNAVPKRAYEGVDYPTRDERIAWSAARKSAAAKRLLTVVQPMASLATHRLKLLASSWVGWQILSVYGAGGASVAGIQPTSIHVYDSQVFTYIRSASGSGVARSAPRALESLGVTSQTEVPHE